MDIAYKNLIAPIVLALLFSSGCVLKNYSQMDLVTKVHTCEEIDQEIAKTQAYIAQLYEEGGWSWRDLRMTYSISAQR